MDTMQSSLPAFPVHTNLAMAYVPFQTWETPMMAEEALQAGTVFPSLVMPFLMGKGGEGDAEPSEPAFGAYGKG